MGTWDIGPFENDMAADFADLNACLGTSWPVGSMGTPDNWSSGVPLCFKCPAGSTVGDCWCAVRPNGVLPVSLRRRP
jgi:hypothetical protein